MNTFKIITDETADLPQGILPEGEVRRLYMPCIVNDVEYNENNFIDLKDYYKLLEEGGMPKTSQINTEYAKNAIVEELEKGNDVLYISFSSGMSGSYSNLVKVVDRLRVDYPDRQIKIVDSLSGCAGEGLLVYYAYKQMQEGKTINDVYEYLMNKRLNMFHCFVVRDIKFLQRGGRISKLEAVIGTVLDIKLILSLSISGKITPIGKAIGNKKVIKAMANYVIENYDENTNDFLVIQHGNCEYDIKPLIERIKASIPNIRIETMLVNKIVGAHSGVGALALFFMDGPSRKKGLPIL